MELNIKRDDWIIEKLGDFAISQKGKKPKNQSTIQTDIYKYPYVDIQAFEKKIFDSYTDGEKCNFCTEDDFLMVWDGSRSGLVGKAIDGAIGSTLVKINLSLIEDHFAYYFLKSKYLEINTKAKGTGTPHVNPDLLWNYNFPIVPILEQKAIVSKIEQLFSELDNGIENLKIAQNKLKIYRQAVLKKAFEGELTKEWREKQTDLPTANKLLEDIKKEREKHYLKHLKEWKERVKEWEDNGKDGTKPKKPQPYKPMIDDTVNILMDTNLPNKWKYNILIYSFIAATIESMKSALILAELSRNSSKLKLASISALSLMALIIKNGTSRAEQTTATEAPSISKASALNSVPIQSLRSAFATNWSPVAMTPSFSVSPLEAATSLAIFLRLTSVGIHTSPSGTYP